MVTAIGASVGMVIDVKIEKEHKRKMLVDSYFDLLEKCGQAVKRGD